MWSTIDIADRRSPTALAVLKNAMDKYHKKNHDRDEEMEVTKESASAPRLGMGTTRGTTIARLPEPTRGCEVVREPEPIRGREVVREPEPTRGREVARGPEPTRQSEAVRPRPKSQTLPPPRPHVKSFNDINDDSDDEDYQGLGDDDDEGDEGGDDEVEAEIPTTATKSRREPQNSGFVLEPACQRCYLADRLCLEDKAGGSCVHCKKLKYKCDYAAGRKKKQEVSVPRRRKLTEKEVRYFDEDDNSGGEMKGKGKKRVQEAVKPEVKKGRPSKFDTDEEEEYEAGQRYFEVSDDDDPMPAPGPSRTVIRPGPARPKPAATAKPTPHVKPTPCPKPAAKSRRASGKAKAKMEAETAAVATLDLSELVTKGTFFTIINFLSLTKFIQPTLSAQFPGWRTLSGRSAVMPQSRRGS